MRVPRPLLHAHRTCRRVAALYPTPNLHKKSRRLQRIKDPLLCNPLVISLHASKSDWGCACPSIGRILTRLRFRNRTSRAHPRSARPGSNAGTAASAREIAPICIASTLHSWQPTKDSSWSTRASVRRPLRRPPRSSLLRSARTGPFASSDGDARRLRHRVARPAGLPVSPPRAVARVVRTSARGCPAQETSSGRPGPPRA